MPGLRYSVFILIDNNGGEGVVSLEHRGSPTHLGPAKLYSSAAKTAASRTNHGINNQAAELVVTSALDELYGDAPGWRRGAHVQGGQQQRNLPGTARTRKATEGTDQ